MRIDLICHPHSPPNQVSGVTVQIDPRPTGEYWVEYTVASAGSLLLPPMKAPERAEDLWNATCFELFARDKGADAYVEFNFSPSFEWAAYAFTGYRANRRNLETHDPEVVISPAGNWFFLGVDALPELGPEPLQIGLSAIIEEVDGTKSYWALAHPPGDKPDFHDPACFALELPAATAP